MCYFFRPYILIILTVCYLRIDALAMRIFEDSSQLKNYLNIGLYTGINQTYVYQNNGFMPSLSYRVDFQLDLGRKWEMVIGLGGISYNKKSLSFKESKIVSDTLNVKNCVISSISYATIPLLIKYKLSQKSSIMAGIRWSYAISTNGNGTFSQGYPAKRDSLILISHLIPNLPDGAHKMDFGGVIGFEYTISRLVFASILINGGGAPIFPAGYKDAFGSKTGNYNMSGELGFHFLLCHFRKSKQ